MSVPPFNPGYFPSKGQMTRKEQRGFFKDLVSRLERGEYLDIESNISYVFVYLYEVIGRRLPRTRRELPGVGNGTRAFVVEVATDSPESFSALSDHLIRIGELYADQAKVADYCHFWAYDCLLAQHKYDEYLEKTEPTTALGMGSSSQSNMRLNVQRWSGREADPIDVLLTSGRNRSSSFIRQHEALYREKASHVVADFAAGRGGWFRLFDTWGCSKEEYGHYLFAGSTSLVPYPRKIACYYSAQELDVVSELAREAENQARASLGVPGVGQGWISETELFLRVKAEFAETSVIQHGHPSWLGMQHFDVWMPHWRIAVEYQGRQHFEPVEYFGGAEAYERTVERDRRKAELARQEGVALLLVTDADDVEVLLERIRQIRGRQLATAYRGTDDQGRGTES